ncbi:MAG: hypothetical protein KAT68_04895 [Bacteroidales bacterium]|nr:hypothetical protein [Bacteroidales bacterium]
MKIKKILPLMLFIFCFLNIFSQEEQIIYIDKNKIDSTPDSLKVYFTVDSMPEFNYKNENSLEKSFEHYFRDSLILSDKFDCQGNVYVRFIVEKDGSLGDIEIVYELKNCSNNEFINNEIINVLSKMPKWKPGNHYGEFRRVAKTMQIKI